MTIVNMQLDEQLEKIAHGKSADQKNPLTRLLDLALGWAEFVERDETRHPDSVTSEDLHEFYQAIGQMASDAAPEMQAATVRQIVDTHLLPLLLGQNKRQDTAQKKPDEE